MYYRAANILTRGSSFTHHMHYLQNALINTVFRDIVSNFSTFIGFQLPFQTLSPPPPTQKDNRKVSTSNLHCGLCCCGGGSSCGCCGAFWGGTAPGTRRPITWPCNGSSQFVAHLAVVAYLVSVPIGSLGYDKETIGNTGGRGTGRHSVFSWGMYTSSLNRSRLNVSVLQLDLH